ncbi:MAG: hypothetical protein ACF8LL_02350, partial [Phycisphaerales bacterium]
KPESTLPADPKKSIEAMLEDILASTTRTEKMLANLDETRIDDLARRVRTIYDSLLNVKVTDIVDIERRLEDIERQFRGIGSTTRLEDLVRDIDRLERDMRDAARQVADDSRRDLNALQNDLRRIDMRLGRVERKID